MSRQLEERLAAVAPVDAPGFSQPWPFSREGGRRIRARLDDGAMTEREATDLLDFVEHGYVVWPGLVDDDLIDRLVSDVRRVGQHPGRFVTTAHRHGKTYDLSTEDFDAFESIFDTYVNFASARDVCLHPTILRFLELLFDAKPVAFQQLLFQRSNQHPLHQDTAYVCVEEPLQLAATWVALEDVVPGRGELTYYDGSHRVPHYFYGDGSKRFNPGADDEDAARRYLAEQCEALGCEKRDFIAKKGDVFLWAADLVHGSNPRTRPETETRMACVTHYCPETTAPFWFRFHPQNRHLEACGDRAYIASSYYRLPARGRMLRPTFEIPD